MKRAVAVLSAVIMSGVCLFLLERTGNLKLATLGPLFAHHASLLLGMACCQTIVTFISVWRYRLLLDRFGIRLPFARLVGPTLVGQAVGVWLPASIAVTEAIRLGLMLGLSRRTTATSTPEARARIALASLLDRLVGQATMLLVGGTIGLTLVLVREPSVKLRAVLTGFSLFSVASGLGLLLFPALGGGRWIMSVATRLARAKSAPLGRVGVVVANLSERVVQGVSVLVAHPKWVLGPALLSSSILALAALALYLPGLAMPVPPGYLAAIVGIPLLALSQLLPLGFAGLGSQQLLTVGIFSAFYVDDASVTSASLAQNAVSLVTTTLLGAVASGFLARDLAELRRVRRAA